MAKKDLSMSAMIHDWNSHRAHPFLKQNRGIHFADESFRDGLQSPSIRDPDMDEKLKMLHLSEKLGIHAADLGLPGSGPRAVEDITRLAREIKDNNFKMVTFAAVRTHEADIRPLIDISQKVGMPIEAATFIGSSPIRQYAEGWDIDVIIKKSVEAIKLAVNNDLPVMYVTEDTTRAKPEDIRTLYTAAIEVGARRVCVCDTCGYVTPQGVFSLLEHVFEVIKDTGENVKVDWHGHNDRGLGVANSLAAIYAGVDRVHGTMLGIGERVGNAALDQILVNLKLDGLIDNDLTALAEYCDLVARVCHGPLPSNYPVMGEDAFRTATGVHAAAIIKAEKKGDKWLADRVYSGVTAGDFGKDQRIEIGFMSGLSNVKYWLAKHDISGSDGELEKIAMKVFALAKQSQENLSDKQIMRVISECKSETVTK
ncbi:MAG: LeuA family protein [Candidatus Zixiibacteriota bacterium]